MKDEASRAGLTDLFTRHDAVDGATSELNAFLPYVNQNKAFNIKGRRLSEGQIGCFASHFTLWKEIAESRNGAIIMEDDIRLTDELSIFLSDAPGFFDRTACIRLFSNETKKSKAIPLHRSSNYSICRYSKGHMGTQAYYLSPPAAARFVDHAKEWYLPVDLYMDAFWAHGVECLGTDPALIIRQESPTVRTGSTRKKLGFKERIRKEIATIGPQVRRRIHNGIFSLKTRTKTIRSLQDL